eukprot:evm.model.scf_1232.2 EVM.evm.TU.scf_1232.2   scf_1232:23915-28355(-)
MALGCLPSEGGGGRPDLRRGVLVFSALQAALAGPRLVAALAAAWAAGSAYLALVPGAVMYGLAGWAGLKATQDPQLVLRWDPSVQAAAKLCTAMGCIANAVDAAALAYLLSWQSVRSTPPSMVVYVAVQQSFLVGMETCMLFVVWSYQQRVRLFQPVMPLQEPLLASCEAEDSSSRCSSSLKDLLPVAVNPLASLWVPRSCPGPLQCQSSEWQWRWERLETADEYTLNAEEPDRTCALSGPGVCDWDKEGCGEGAQKSDQGETSGEGANGLVDIKVDQPVVCQICGQCNFGGGGQCACTTAGGWRTGDVHCVGDDERVYVSIVF